MNRVYAVLSNINQAVVRIRETDALFQHICKIVVKDGGLGRAWIGIYNKTSKAIVIESSAGLVDVLSNTIEIAIEPEQVPQYPAIKAFRTGEHCVCNDIENDFVPNIWREQALKLGIYSSAIFPIIIAGEVRGLLSLDAFERNFFDTQEVQLLDELVMDISFALEFIEQEHERKRAEEALGESEERFRSLFENATIGMYRTTPSGDIMLANPTLMRMMGFDTFEELCARNIEKDGFIAEYPRSHFIDMIESQGVIQGLESAWKRKDGSIIYVRESARLARDGDGKVLYYEGTVEDISERHKAEEEIKSRAREFEALYETTRDLAHQHDLDTLLLTIAKRAAQLLDAHSVVIYLFDKMRQDLVIAISQDPLVTMGIHLAIGEGVAGQVALTRQPVIVGDYPTWPHRSAKFDGLAIRSVVGVPMEYSGELIGVLVVRETGESGRQFSQSDLRLLSLFASQAASAVHGTRLFEETRRRLAEVEAINKISSSQWIAQTTDEMLPRFLWDSLSVLGSHDGVIWLFDPQPGSMLEKTTMGWFTQLDERSVTPGEGIAGTVFASGEPHLSAEFATDPLTHSEARDKFPRGWGGACVPVRTAQEVVGVLFVSVQLPRQLRQDEINLLATLSEIAGSAIHRMRLHEQTEQRLRRLVALRTVDMTINSSMDLRLTLNVAFDQLATQLGVDAAAVFLFNSHLQMLEYAAGCGFRSRAIEHARLRLGEGNSGRATLERQIIRDQDLLAPESQYAYKELLLGENFTQQIVVPLVAKGRLLGVLEIFHRSPLSPDQDWMEFMETMAGQAAIAIDNTRLFNDLQRSNLELTISYVATIEGWSQALDMRDRETEGHTQRVTEMTVQMARAMGFSDEELAHIRRGALLHDIGKMAIPDSVLLKPGPLDEEEWKIMRMHPVYAHDMLSPILYLKPALDIPYCHHEKRDGGGYPRGLKGDQIPLAARLFAIVDVWDALRSDRPYRKAWTDEDALKYILDQSGEHFDPQVVEVFKKLDHSIVYQR